MTQVVSSTNVTLPVNQHKKYYVLDDYFKKNNKQKQKNETSALLER